MGIISVSIDSDLIEALDAFVDEEKFSGRSDAVRQAVTNLILQENVENKLKGDIEGVMLLIHKESGTKKIHDILHKYLSIIKTQVHNHLESHKCLEIFVLKGNAKKIKDLKKDLGSESAVEFVKLLIA